MSSNASRFGPYELVRRLGAGGMAETFLAVRRGPGSFEQHVCVKRILPAFESDDDFVRLFLEEARLSAKLRHANIVQVLDFGVADGSHFLALELVEGLDLRAFLRRLQKNGQTLTSGLVSYIAFELGNALEFAHQAAPDGSVRGVVHRDISPSNILLSRAGEVKLTDFGIAKAMNQPGTTRSGVIKGKVPYMAPEYARTGRFDARADLFSLGVTLYECLAGRRPFEGRTDLDTMSKIIDGDHTPLAEIVPSAPKQLVEAIERLISASPSARFATAAELLDALVDVAPPPTARRILGELVRRHESAPEEPKGLQSDSVSMLYGATREATPATAAPGTMVLEGSGDPVVAPPIREAGPNEPTRTSLAAAAAAASAKEEAIAKERAGALDPPIVDERAGEPSIPAPAHAPSAAPRAEPAMRPSAIAEAPTRQLEAPREGRGAVAVEERGSGTVTAGVATRGTRARAIAIGVIAVAAAVALGYVALSQSGASDPVASPAPPPDVHTTAPEPATRRGASTPAARVDPAEPSAAASERTGTGTAGEPTRVEEVGAEAPEPERPIERIKSATRRTRRGAGERTAAATTTEAAEPEPDPREERPATGQATVTVVVVPYGDVWIDGRHAGTAPVTANVRAGRHTIGTGDGAPTRTTTIDLRPGQRERVTMRRDGP